MDFFLAKKAEWTGVYLWTVLTTRVPVVPTKTKRPNDENMMCGK